MIWEASDRVCGKRLRALLPVLVEAMERHGHLQLAAEVRRHLLAMSAATIDRALRDAKNAGQAEPAPRTLAGDPAERAGADLLRLAGSAAGVRRGGSGGAQRAAIARQLRADAGADRHRHRLDRMRAAAGARADAADRGAEGAAQAAAVRAARVRHRQRHRVHERDRAGLLRRREDRRSRAAGPIARTTRPGSSRRTARWCGGSSATGGSRVWRPRRCWRSSTRRCGCS